MHILIIIGLLAVAGGIVYFVTRKSTKTSTPSTPVVNPVKSDPSVAPNKDQLLTTNKKV